MAAKPKHQPNAKHPAESCSVPGARAAAAQVDSSDLGESIAGTAISAELSESFSAESSHLILNEAQAIWLLDLLDNPPTPTDAMWEAMKRYKELIRPRES